MLQCIQHFPSILESVEETLEKRPRRGNSETYLGMVVCITELKRLKPIWDSSQNKIKCIIIYLSILAGSPSPSYVTKEDPPDPVCPLFRYSEPFRNLICITAGMSYQAWSVGSSIWTCRSGFVYTEFFTWISALQILCIWDTTSHGKLGYLVPTLSKEAQSSHICTFVAPSSQVPGQLVQEVHRGYSCFMISTSTLNTGSHFLWYLTFAYVAKNIKIKYSERWAKK